jgi:hypothetical protein
MLMPRSLLRRITLAVAAVCAAGCSLTDGLSHPKIPNTAVTDRPAPDSSPVTPLLEMMAALPKGDPARQAEVFQSAKDAAQITPTTSNKLKWALALATPGHSGSDPVAARRQLSELLARPETLLPAERLLAAVELQEIEQRLVMQAEDQRLREELPRESREKLATANRRLNAESDENARLRKALDEAEAKLEAIKHVERSTNDSGARDSRAP